MTNNRQRDVHIEVRISDAEYTKLLDDVHGDAGDFNSWCSERLLSAAVPGPGRVPLEWNEGTKGTEGPFKGEVTKWSAVSRVPDGVLYWSITRAAPERFVLRVKDDNRTDTVALGHRPTREEIMAVAERLQFVLDPSS